MGGKKKIKRIDTKSNSLRSRSEGPTLDKPKYFFCEFLDLFLPWSEVQKEITDDRSGLALATEPSRTWYDLTERMETRMENIDDQLNH